MLLSDLVAGVGSFGVELGVETRGHSGRAAVERIEFDSRRVRPGDLFACVKGDTVDGHTFAAQAVSAGATALLVDRWLDVEATQVRVDNVREAMGWFASTLAGEPSKQLRVVGITGTNGKTTTAHLVASICNDLGQRAEVLGTLTSTLTTLEAPRLQCQLRSFVESGLDLVAMEVSSHALAQHRVTGTHFELGVFTNLSADHLDYHGDLDSYFEAKALLFQEGRIDAAVINVGDARGAQLAERVAVPKSTFRVDDLSDVTLSFDGSTFIWRSQQVSVGLPGLFNIENALAAAETCRALGFSEPDIAAGLAAAEAVPGRFEVVSGSRQGTATVIVDYSHTPAGLEQVLRSVREIDPLAPLCVVFGAGGDRDRAKRPLMGAAASSLSDHVILTSDNPRSEDPDAIIVDIHRGTNPDSRVDIEPDRRRAIALALETHDPNAVVVVAGKGHETTQTIGDTRIDFDDRAVVRELVAGGGS
ncbi:MAG: UDP-N-acetylmuramoyl-L-alanyl-D-glutamate--2,6-diaminopimelate ligase [Acidimicrobiales bacterium]